MSFSTTARTVRKTRIPLIVSLLVVIAVVAVAAAILMQTFPQSPTVPQTVAVTTAGCAGPLSYPSTMPPGPAIVVVGCGSGPSVAFSAVPGGPDTPTFTFPTTGIIPTALGIATSTSGCSTPIPLTSGSTITLGQTSYYYCVSYPSSTGGTISSFTISWSS